MSHPVESADASADPRRDDLVAWLAGSPGGVSADAASLRPASSDASFRRYFRVDCADGVSRIVMDAPPGKEDTAPYLWVAGLLRDAGLAAPAVVAADPGRGFVLLEDLGERTYLSELQDARASGDEPRTEAAMRAALGALVRMQGIDAALPPYDEARLRAELDLFPEWYVGRHLGASLDAAEAAALARVFDALLASALAQPRVFVHRDFHSRNLMHRRGAEPGVLDFQDAVSGPITYDLASLLRDAYIAWPEERQLDWAIRYWEAARAAGLPVAADFADFYRDFEWMGLQRHLKVLGIFARLYHRDGKSQYLGDLPQVMAYARAVAGRYRDLAPLLRLLDRLAGVEREVGYTF